MIIEIKYLYLLFKLFGFCIFCHKWFDIFGFFYFYLNNFLLISINWNGVSFPKQRIIEYLMFLSCKQHFSSRNLWLSNLSIFHFLSKSILRHRFNRNSLNLLDFWILHMFQIKISRVKIKINPFLDFSKSTRQFIIKFSLVLTWFYEKCWIFL